MPDENIDSLQIEITSSAESSVEHLNGLITSLRKLNRIGKSDGLTIVKKQLQGIASIKFNNLSDQLKNVVSYVEQLEAVNKRISREITKTVKTPTVDTSATTSSISDVVDEIKETTERASAITEDFNVEPPTADWVDEVKGECEKTLDTFSGFSEKIQARRDKLRSLLNDKKDNFGETPAFVTASSFETGLDDALQKLILQAELLDDKFTKLSRESGTPDKKKWYDLEKAIISVKQQYASLLRQTDKNAISVDALGKQAVKSTHGLGKLLDKFKNVLVYRVVRFLLSQIMKAASEGLRHISQFSEEANKITSAYQTQFLYMKNSIGSALLPILQSLLPILIRISDGFVDIANSIGMVSAALNGNGTFIKAKKYAQDYAQSLEQVKRSTTGFDELNILGQQNTNADTSQMFEEVEVTTSGVLESLGKVTTLLGTLIGLLAVFKGKQIASFFINMGKGLKSAYSSLKNMTTWKKGILSFVALATEAMVCYNAFYDLTRGTDNLDGTLLKVIPICAAVGVAMCVMRGPVGLVIAAVVALTSAIIGVAKAQIDMTKEAAMAEFFAVEGAAIKEVTASMDRYFQSIGITKQQEMNEALTAATEELIDARFAYDSFWQTIKDADELDTAQIEKLSSAFSDLADATNSFNSAAIESAMASLKTGIEMNITPELTDRLNGLVSSLQAAQDLLGIKVSGLNTEYQKILNDMASGKMSVSEAKPKLEELRSKMNDFTLSSDASSTGWKIAIEDAMKNGINAGTDKDSIAETLNSLASERDTYLSTLQESYKNSRSVLEQLIKIDKEQFGGALGFSEADLKTLEENYNAQVAAVTEQFNAVVQAIYDSYAKNALDYNQYNRDNDFLNVLDTICAAIAGLFGWAGVRNGNGDTGWEHIGNKNAAKEQRDILEWILTYLVPAHAEGGIVEDGLFMANHNELVGQFTNGKTAVANNMQIIAGIKQGVSEALQENGNQGGDWTIQIVDEDGRVRGETIITAAERKNRRDGKTVISVGG